MNHRVTFGGGSHIDSILSDILVDLLPSLQKGDELVIRDKRVKEWFATYLPVSEGHAILRVDSITYHFDDQNKLKWRDVDLMNVFETT